MESDIYGAGPSLAGSLIGFAVGLFVVVGGFILASRYLIGRRIDQFEREWRRSQQAKQADDPDRRASDDATPPPEL
jgi:hypothetical protein